jgi:hypothetical protein
MTQPRTYRTRISPIERAAKAASDAMRLAREALIEHAGLTEDQAKLVVLAIRGGLVPGAKMEILQP